MDNSDGTYVDDREITIFYQLLGVAPQVAAALFEPSMSEAARAWLNDVYDAAIPVEQRRLRVLFLYYGLVTGDPMSYREISEEMGIAGGSVRKLAARGLRYLWFVTHTERLPKSKKAREKVLVRLFDRALVANEWTTCDPRDKVSFEGWMEVISEVGYVEPVKTPKTPTQVSPTPKHKLREAPSLWNPVWAAKAPLLAWPKRLAR